jgi:hypothetical protein
VLRASDINKSFALIVNVTFRQQSAEFRMVHEDSSEIRILRSVNAIKVANFNQFVSSETRGGSIVEL